eukprot:3438767-Rhodomonas_salina.1
MLVECMAQGAGRSVLWGSSTVAPSLARVFRARPQGAPVGPGRALGSQLAIWGFLCVRVVGAAG